MPIDILLSLSAALSFTVGGIFMEWSDGLSRFWPSLAIYGLFCAGASFQTLAIKNTSMGATYVLVVGLEAMIAMALSIFILKENHSILNLGGVVLIIIGVIFLRSKS
jgi:multidrug transporter EmrE-like cation transporter